MGEYIQVEEKLCAQYLVINKLLPLQLIISYLTSEC